VSFDIRSYARDAEGARTTTPVLTKGAIQSDNRTTMTTQRTFFGEPRALAYLLAPRDPDGRATPVVVPA
jgi:hypothetical protein